MIELDLTWYYAIVRELMLLGTLSPDEVMWKLYIEYYGWLFVFIAFLRWGLWPEYMKWVQGKYYDTIKFVLFAVDVPKDNEQPIKSMEKFFVHLLGAHGSVTKWEKYIEGKFQLSLYIELISIDGHIQFLIRTPEKFRDMVEAGIYAQYPDAEVTEVEDYVDAVPKTFPDDEWDMWGVEFGLDSDTYYPLKVEMDFEHSLSATYVDPMAGLLEAMSKIGKGEQIWLQWIIKPLGHDWAKDAQEIIDKAKGQSASKDSLISKLLGKAADTATFTFNESIGVMTDTTLGGEAAEEGPTLNPLLTMTPGERDKLKALETKVSKLAFDVKMRLLYVAKKEVYNNVRGVNSIIGALKQWNTVGIQGFKPMLKETGTRAFYFAVPYRIMRRKNIIMGAYRARSGVTGTSPFKLNVEELASIWHFPNIYVKTPFVKAVEGKKAEAPVSLPFEEEEEEAIDEAKPDEKELPEADKQKVPETEQAADATFDYDNDFFEERFAKDKKSFKQTSEIRKKRLEEKAEQKAVKEKKEAEQAEKQEQENAKKQKQVAKDSKKQNTQKKSESGKNSPPSNLPFT